MEVADGLLGIVFYRVGDHDVANRAAVDGDVQNRPDLLTFLPDDSVFGHELIVANEHTFPVDHGKDAVSGLFAHVAHAVLVDAGGERFLDGNGDGVVAERFRVSGGIQKACLVDAFFRANGNDLECAGGKRAGLIEDHGVNVRKQLEIV